MQTALPGFSLPPLPEEFSGTITYRGKSHLYLVTWTYERKKPVFELLPDGNATVTAPSDMSVSEVQRYVENEYKKIFPGLAADRTEKAPLITSGVFHIRGISIPYTVDYHYRRRTSTVCYFPEGRLVVQARADATPDELTETLEKHKEWIYLQVIRGDPQYRRGEEGGSLLLGEEQVPYRITYSSRAKRMTLKVSLMNPVTVVVPFETDSESIRRFVEANRGWIADKLGIPDPESRYENDNFFIYADGREIPYHIRTSSRAKRIVLKIHTDNTVEVVAPPRENPVNIHRFVQDKADWVVKKILYTRRPEPPVREYHDGDLLPVLGCDHRLSIVTGTKHPSSELKDGVVEVCIPAGLPPYSVTEAVKQGYTKVLLKTVQEVSCPLIQTWSKRLEIPPPMVKFGNQKTKWGVCSPRGIILNIRLAMAPIEVIEYVVVHELCHVKQPNHSKKFWKLVELMLPDYKDRIVSLKHYGSSYIL